MPAPPLRLPFCTQCVARDFWQEEHAFNLGSEFSKACGTGGSITNRHCQTPQMINQIASRRQPVQPLARRYCMDLTAQDVRAIVEQHTRLTDDDTAELLAASAMPQGMPPTLGNLLQALL